jgi:hypothetical protein
MMSFVKFNAQNKTECFRNYLEYKSDSPSLKIDDKLTQRTSGDQIMMRGIKNYLFKDVDQKNLKKQLQTEIWGVRQDGKVYINAYPLAKFKGYNEIIGIGHYSYFIGLPPTSLDKKNQQKLGFIEPGKPAIYISATAVGYVLLEDGTIKFLNRELLGTLVEGNAELEEKVKLLDNKNGNLQNMFEILDMLNKIVK